MSEAKVQTTQNETRPSCMLGKEDALSRRNFLKLGLTALGALAAIEAGGMSLFFLRSRAETGEFGGVITAGAVGEFAAGTVTEFPDSRFFLIRTTDGGFMAVHSRCPHLGCTVIWLPEENKFLCPCHASHFDEHGDFENPPVPRPLDLFSVEIEKGKVRVDTSHLHQRDHYDPQQLVYEA